MFMHVPYLTILIPTLQAESTLQESLDSLINQDFRDFEILIMDSVSHDGTLAIARDAAEKDRRIRVFSAPDNGVYDAMNKGIQQARGQWIYFLGSDDFMYNSQVLSTVFAIKDRDRFDLLYGNVVSPSYSGVYDREFTFKKLLERNISHQAIFYRRTIFDFIGNYNVRYKGHADWDLNIRCFSDNRVRRLYIDMIIARFGADGLSSRHDVPFLQEVLFPERLQLLEHTQPRALRSVCVYDQWWRLVRNGDLSGRALEKFAGGSAIPRPVAEMSNWQKKIPHRLLHVGVISKLLMFASYTRHFLTAALK
jgi:glycosyltransferase involved in cell wall biosynthesis